MDEVTLQQALANGQKAWPDIQLEPASFRKHLRQVLGAEPNRDWQQHAADLYIACACASGIPGAPEALERRYGPALESPIRRLGSEPELLEQTLLALRNTVFCPNGKIGDYSARGTLEVWLGTACTRLALDMLRRKLNPWWPRPN